ncbi:MAG: permease [Bacteroidetes bacterium 4572_117]|nr:MAG: permease [Bacteroidetes bacterium 4572_117]
MDDILVLLVIGLVAGFLSGSMGIGGGVVIVPSLIFFMGFSLHQGQGTSLAFMSMPIMLVAASNFYKEGFVNVKATFLLVIPFIIGGYLGSKFSIMMPERIMRIIFGVFMIIIALKMIFTK